jgi:tetratricopeptide (TPR) repeat protein
MTKTLIGHIGFALAIGLLATASLAADAQPFSKDVGPASSTCDAFDKGSSAWNACVGKASASLNGDEAFYAGYWLAKAGNYQDALDYLRVAPQTDARVLTYIGFATRKLGDVDGALQYYDRALRLNPNYSVARAYLGDAFLSRGEPAKAQSQLEEIDRRCGRSCAEYAELARHIAADKS